MSRFASYIWLGCVAFFVLLTQVCAQNALAANNSASAQSQSMKPSEEVVMTESTVQELGAPPDLWERIRRGYGMQTLNSPLVDKWIAFYAKDPRYMQRMTERAGRYLYHIVEEVEARGMPSELALLPFVESAFQPEALSHAKAAGLWQFMPATGTYYSLEQNLWRDDRRDVLESTRAALDYFNYLYGMFGDWYLALAAYNWGEGSVQRAIRSAKARHQPVDYLHLRMPTETANYVPKLEAIKRLISDPAKYGVELPDVGNEPFFVSITKPRDIDTKTAAELAGMDLKEFRQLNPSYKLPVIVAAHDSIMLLPADRVDEFIDNLASWMDSGQPLSRWTTYKLKAGEPLSEVAERFGMTESKLREVNGIPQGRRVLANSTLLVRANGDEQSDISAEEADGRLRLSPATTWRRVVYRVRAGDSLSTIARRWHITTKSIVTANRLRSDRLRVGQRLSLTVPNVPRASIQYASTPKSSHKIYAVKPGDTLSTIARRHDVSVETLKATNRLTSNFLKVGQRLRIPSNDVSVMPGTTYSVRSGDTLSSIAKRYGVSVVKLKRANRLESNTLRVGQTLEIPEAKAVAPEISSRPAAPESRFYTVRSGDTLSEIAKRVGTTVSSLKAANGLRKNTLRVGQKLIIPQTAKVSSERVVKKVSESGSSSEQKIHTVRAGETLSSIARAKGTSIALLKRTNKLKTNLLKVGQKLIVP